MTMQTSPAIAIALAHIDAWSRHDWVTTRELLAPDVVASVARTQPQFGSCVEFSGREEYMARKMRGAQLVEPGSVKVLASVGDATGALVTIALRIRLGPDNSPVTMARACAYAIDPDHKIKEERDVFFVVSE